MPSTQPLALSVTLWLLTALAGCGGEAPPPEPVLRPVRSIEVTRSSAARQPVFAGVTRAGVESRLSFRVSGTIRDVLVEVGDTVRRGQTLARLDPTDYELKVEEAEASLAQGQASLRQAEADYERVRALYENNNASKSDLDASRAAAESAQARVEAGTKQLEQARQQLAYTVLRAPLSGAIAEVDIEVNENVQAGSKVFLLTSGVVPEVTIAVPEALISRLHKGQPATVRLDALPGRNFDAEISEVAVAAAGSGAAFDIIVRLAEPNPAILSGMAADVELLLEDAGTTIRVPPVAVGEDRFGRFVFVVEPAGGGAAVVHRREVTVGQFSLEGIEILDGLQVGERVVTAGVRRLSDGQRVLLAQEEGARG